MKKKIKLLIMVLIAITFIGNLHAQELIYNVSINGELNSFTVPTDKIGGQKESFGAVGIVGRINATQYVVDKSISFIIQTNEVGKYEIGYGKKTIINFSWEKGSKQISSKRDEMAQGFVEITKKDEYEKLSGKFKYVYTPSDYEKKNGSKSLTIEGSFKDILIK